MVALDRKFDDPKASLPRCHRQRGANGRKHGIAAQVRAVATNANGDMNRTPAVVRRTAPMRDSGRRILRPPRPVAGTAPPDARKPKRELSTTPPPHRYLILA